MKHVSLFGAVMLLAQLLISPLACAAELPAPSHPLEFRDGERVALIGGTFIERLQSYGYLESLLTAAQPDRNVTFRNLGWSGDTVWGESRAVFGQPRDGFQRLLRDLAQTEPTTLVVAYGAVEAEAGDAGLDAFKVQLNTLLTELEKICPRIILLTPLARENVGAPLPNQDKYNAKLPAYANAIGEVAKARGHAVVDVSDLVGRGQGVVSGTNRLTDNGLHLTAYGDWRTSPRLAEKLSLQAPTWKITGDASGKLAGEGTELKDISATARGLRFVATDKTLPYAPPPPHAPAGAAKLGPQRMLQVSGLPAGKYEVLIDGAPALATDAAALAAGVRLSAGPEFKQEGRLRSAIATKNELYFNRYRPQNETYLFLFRKHEQGNNAKEIPEFDPLIAAKEKEIAALRAPQSHTYEIVIVESENK